MVGAQVQQPIMSEGSMMGRCQSAQEIPSASSQLPVLLTSTALALSPHTERP